MNDYKKIQHYQDCQNKAAFVNVLEAEGIHHEVANSWWEIIDVAADLFNRTSQDSGNSAELAESISLLKEIDDYGFVNVHNQDANDMLHGKLEDAIAKLEALPCGGNKVVILYKKIISAWESLSEGEHDSGTIQSWLSKEMKPIIDEVRREIKSGGRK